MEGKEGCWVTAVLNQTWDLDVFFRGGSSSPELVAQLDRTERDLAVLMAEVRTLPACPDDWADFLDRFQQAAERFYEAVSFVYCLMSQDVRDRQAVVLYGRVQQSEAAVRSIISLLEGRTRDLTDAEWQALVDHPRLAPAAFALNERRRRASDQMETGRELLANDLAVDGYHAYDTLYSTVVGRITIPFEGQELSVGQAYNRFFDPDRAVRQALFVKWEEAFAKEADLFAHVLNHLAGFRLGLYRHRGWQSVLKEPLEMNRMRPETLEAMWDAVASARPTLRRFLDRKARLLGAEKLAWYDLTAPVNQATRNVTYDEAAAFVEEQFRKFSPRMADFAAQAFRRRWLEVEDRPHKAPGGYCTSFPQSKESRIFMTFSGDLGGVSTIAHELGHAYHTSLMFDLPFLVQDYAMNVAETASTFAELIVSSAAVQSAASPEEKVAVLGARLDNSVALLMNIHARFLFETRFYERRANGLLSVAELNALMEEAQREAYADGLQTYHPLFWASKGHFYGTQQPFYNFPYTFGFLFSAGIYARALAEGPAFEERYAALLRDTGRMTTEELAMRHLGADLTRPDFWQSALSVVLDDVEEFLRLTAE